MRKAALFSSIIALIILCAALFFRLMDFPGGVFFSLIGSLVLLLVVIPTLFFYRLKSETSPIGKWAAIAGLVAGWSLGLGLLLANMRWPGSSTIFLFGLGLTLIFLVMHVMSRLHKDSPIRKIGVFDVLIPVIFALLLVGRGKARAITANSTEKIQLLHEENFKLSQTNDATIQVILSLDSSELDSIQLDKLYEIENESNKLLQFLDLKKRELLSHGSGLSTQYCGEFNPQTCPRPDDHDLPTFYFVGIDPANPSGAGLLVYENLKKFQSDVLPSGVKLEIDLSETMMKDGENMSWVKAHFYHVTNVEALIVITQFQNAVLNAERQAIEFEKNTAGAIK